MAIPLINKQNTTAADAEYPFGQVKDNPGDNTGTPLNKAVLEDYFQFFHKMFSESGLIYNGVPDNEYDGWQFYEAFEKLTGRQAWTLRSNIADVAPVGGTATISSSTLKYLIVGKTMKVIFAIGGTVTSGGVTSFNLTLPESKVSNIGFNFRSLFQITDSLSGLAAGLGGTFLSNGSGSVNLSAVGNFGSVTPPTFFTNGTVFALNGQFEIEIA